MRGDAYAGKAPAGGAETKAAYGELALGLRVKKANYADAYAETRFLYGLQSEELGPALDVREAYVSGYFGPLDIRLGQQLIVWGVADVLRPTNNLMPFDLRVHSPVEDDRRKSNVAARVFLNFAPFRIEGVWIPVYRSAELPTMPVPEYVAFDQPAFPAPDLANGTEGARVHFELPGFRVSGSYLYGYAPLPGLAFSQIALATPTPIHIKRQAYDHHVVGLDFSLDLEPETTVLAEAAFRFPMHFRSRIFAPNPDLDYVVGVDRKFGSFKLIAQYLGRYTFDWERDESPGVSPATIDEISDDKYAPWYTGQDKPGDTAVANTVAAATAEANAELAEQNQMLFSQLERVQHLASLRLEWLALDDALSLSALGLMNFSTEEWFVSPKVGYRVTNSLSAAIGAEIYGGPSGTLLGTIDEVLSAGFAELRYAF
jgi:hypothetical protein